MFFFLARTCITYINMHFTYSQLLNSVAGFLSRFSDFFTGCEDNAWEKVKSHLQIHFAGYDQMVYTAYFCTPTHKQLLLEQFRKVAVQAKKIQADKQKERDDAERRRQEVLRKKREQESKPAVTELTDAEAEQLQKEIEEEKCEDPIVYLYTRLCQQYFRRFAERTKRLPMIPLS